MTNSYQQYMHENYNYKKVWHKKVWMGIGFDAYKKPQFNPR